MSDYTDPATHQAVVDLIIIDHKLDALDRASQRGSLWRRLLRLSDSLAAIELEFQWLDLWEEREAITSRYDFYSFPIPHDDYRFSDFDPQDLLANVARNHQ